MCEISSVNDILVSCQDFPSQPRGRAGGRVVIIIHFIMHVIILMNARAMPLPFSGIFCVVYKVTLI